MLFPVLFHFHRTHHDGHFHVGEDRVNENFWPAALSAAKSVKFLFPSSQLEKFQFYNIWLYTEKKK